MSVLSATPTDYGIDTDRAQPLEAIPAFVRRRLGGRYPLDPFGGDPQLMDLASPLTGLVAPVDVYGGEYLPKRGGALLVANRGLGMEPFALGNAVRKAVQRKVRLVGTSSLPVVEGISRKLGAIGTRQGDISAALRAGHLVAAPLGITWARSGAGEPPRGVVSAALGFSVIPVAVVPGGPFGLPVGRWRVRIGAPLGAIGGSRPGDALAAAELAERVRRAVDRLLVELQHPRSRG